MKRILVVSWFYPPINSSEGLVTYKLLKNSKLQFDICMQANAESWSYGKDNSFEELNNVKRIYAQSGTLEPWVDEVTKFFETHQDEYDILMTRSMPPESHKIGLNIKRIKPSIKWIASFGDPIANNPFVLKSTNSLSPYSLKNRYQRYMSLREILSPKRFLKNIMWNYKNNKAKKPLRIEQELEANIVQTCDYLIMNSDEQKDYMLGNYGEDIKNKAIVLPHSYDEQLYNVSELKKNDDKISIVYVGHLDDIRTPHAFLEAVKELKEDFPELHKKLEVLFYGNMSVKEKLFLLDNELLDVVKIKKPVTYFESLRIMKEADWLLHIDANLQGVLENNIFFAAKLADYIGAKKPIMGISMTEGPSANILRNLNGLLMSYSVDEIKNYLYLIVYQGYEIQLNTEEIEKFKAMTVAQTFDEFAKSIEI